MKEHYGFLKGIFAACHADMPEESWQIQAQGEAPGGTLVATFKGVSGGRTVTAHVEKPIFGKEVSFRAHDVTTGKVTAQGFVQLP